MSTLQKMLFLLLTSLTVSTIAQDEVDSIGNPPPPLSPGAEYHASKMVRDTFRSHCGELNRDIAQQAPGGFAPKTIVLFGWCLDDYHGWLYYPDPINAAKQTIIRQ